MENKKKSMNIRKIKKQVKGITLIALVVTIIVLLILAGVALSLTVGNNGLFRRAQNAADTWQETSEREAIELAVAGMQIGTTQGNGMTKTELENSLKDQFGDEASVEENEDGSFLVTIGENQYYVGEDGEIIDNSNMLEISTAEELKAFRDDVNSGNTYEGKYVYLTNDITLDSGEEWEPIGVYLNDASTPDDERNIAFKGTFNGNGYEINGIKVNSNEKVKGLFAFVSNEGKIINLGIGTDNNITGVLGTAGLVGYLYNGAEVSNCYNKANITGNGNSIGGVVAICVNSNINNCYNTGTIESTQVNAGGIAGMSTNSTIINSYNLGSISATDNSGGITSLNTSGEMYNCYNVGSISGNSNIGGIVSGNSGKIYMCYNVGNVTSTGDYVGGITGANYGTLYDCYNSQNTIQGQRYVGGICGWNQKGEIYNCYNTGNVTGINTVTGGIIGANGEIVKNCYFLENKINNGNGITIEGITLKNDSEMKEIHSLLSSNFKKDTENINQGYPILNWQ